MDVSWVSWQILDRRLELTPAGLGCVLGRAARGAPCGEAHDRAPRLGQRGDDFVHPDQVELSADLRIAAEAPASDDDRRARTGRAQSLGEMPRTAVTLERAEDRK